MDFELSSDENPVKKQISIRLVAKSTEPISKKFLWGLPETPQKKGFSFVLHRSYFLRYRDFGEFLALNAKIPS